METGHEPCRDVHIEKGLEHAWNWFSLHATHRMQSVNFFLVAVAFLSAGFVAALGIPNDLIAAAVAAMGFFVSIFFNRLELRIKELIHAGEDAMRPFQAHLAQTTGIPAIRILERVETSKNVLTKYSIVISLIHWFSAIAFLSGVVYALFLDP